MKRILWAGDSTVQTNDITTYPQTGIGQVFSLYTKEDVTIINHAKNGRSTKSFIDEGRLQKIDDSLQAGDFLFIQFGHNDEKKEDPTRYTEAYTSFRENLATFIQVARKHGAYPVLITPLERRCFIDSTHLGLGAHSDYVAGMKQTAEKLKVPLIDLYSMSRCELKRVQEVGSKKYYMNLEPGEYTSCPEGKVDNTHLKYEGAVCFAGLIAKGLKEIGGIYADLLIEF